MQKKTNITIVLFFSCSILFSQNKQSYSDFLKRTPEVKSSLLYGFYGYAYALPTKINYIGTGAVISGGINLARFFTKKFHLGIFCGIKTKSLLFEGGSYSKQFSKALKDNYDPSSFHGSDTLLPSFFMKQSQTYSLGGTTLFQYGVSINYPVKYFPLIKAYSMFVHDVLDGSEYNSQIGKKEDDWIDLSYTGYGLSFSFDLADLNKRINLYGTKIILAFYGERYDLRNAKIEDVKLDRFINQPFFDKYAHYYRYGLSLSIGFY